MENISLKDRTVLRELAEKLAVHAEDSKNKKKIENWTRLNGLDNTVKPMVYVHLWETAWSELLPRDVTFKCQTEEGLFFEKQLRRRLWMADHIADEGVVEPIIRYPVGAELIPYGGLKWEISYAEGDDALSGAGHYDPVLLEKSDIDKLKDPVLNLNPDYQKESRALSEDIFSGILTSIPHTANFSPKVVDEYSWLRGLDKIFYDLIDDPVWIHEVLQRICDNMIKRIKLYEEAGLWGPWEKSEPLGSTGLRFAPDMKDYKENMKVGSMKTTETWGFFTSEAFNNVSPEMHNEFAYTYDKQMAPLFKYINVGCCEVLADKIGYIREIPNVRRISVSEWNDFEKAGKEIGPDYVYGYKPSGVPFVMDWDEKAVKAELDRVLAASSGCPTELILNIGGTTGKKGKENLIRWTEIANRCVEEHMSRR